MLQKCIVQIQDGKGALDNVIVHQLRVKLIGERSLRMNRANDYPTAQIFFFRKQSFPPASFYR
jgi:hypothetical protein